MTNPALDNTPLVDFINNIPNGRIIVIGTKEDPSIGLKVAGL